MTIFSVSLAIHLVLWRIYVPKTGVRALLKIFFGTLITAILLLYIASAASVSFRHIAPDNIAEYIHICIFFTAMALSYIITYVAIEADSPSIVMIMKISGAGPEGLPKKELRRALTDDLLIKPRIEDLLNDKLILTDRDRYRLTSKGSRFVCPFIMYRKLLGLQKGG